MPEQAKENYSSGEYSGIENEAQVAVGGIGKDLANVLSSGEHAQDKRRQNRKKKEKEDAEEKGKEKEGNEANKG